jgi:hypothetical protein
MSDTIEVPKSVIYAAIGAALVIVAGGARLYPRGRSRLSRRRRMRRFVSEMRALRATLAPPTLSSPEKTVRGSGITTEPTTGAGVTTDAPSPRVTRSSPEGTDYPS